MSLRWRGAWLLLLASFPPAGQAATIRVPQDQPTITDGIASASPGDSVIVSCGIYFESGIQMKDEVVLRSETGVPECVRIDGDYENAGLACNSLGSGCWIEGITIVRCKRAIYAGQSVLTMTKCNLEANLAPAGEFSGNGGAMMLQNSNVSISDSFISENNTSFGHQGDPPMGGGIYSYNSSLEIESTVFVSNHASIGSGITLRGSSSAIIKESSFLDHHSSEGVGGIYVLQWTGSLQILGCQFQGNAGSILTNGQNGDETVVIQDSDFREEFTDFSVLTLIRCASVVERCLFAGNTAPSGCVFTNDCLVQGCTFASNQCPYGTIRVSALDLPTTVFLSKSILALNAGPAIQCEAKTSITLDCCDLWGNTDGDWVDCIADQLGAHGNFSSDPLFCDLLLGDYTLRTNSPCAPPLSGDCDLIGSEVIGCKPVATESRSWGSIKSLYR